MLLNKLLIKGPQIQYYLQFHTFPKTNNLQKSFQKLRFCYVCVGFFYAQYLLKWSENHEWLVYYLFQDISLHRYNEIVL